MAGTSAGKIEARPAPSAVTARRKQVDREQSREHALHDDLEQVFRKTGGDHPLEAEEIGVERRIDQQRQHADDARRQSCRWSASRAGRS